MPQNETVPPPGSRDDDVATGKDAGFAFVFAGSVDVIGVNSRGRAPFMPRAGPD